MSDEEKAAAPAGAEEQSVEERVRNAVKEFVGKADLETIGFKAVKSHITEVFGKAVYKQTKDSVKKWAHDEVQRLHSLREGAEDGGTATDGAEDGGEEQEEEEEEEEEDEEEGGGGGDDGQAYEEEEEEEPADDGGGDDDDDDEDYDASSSRKRLRKGKSSKKRRLKRGARDSDDEEDAEEDEEDEAPRGRKQRKKSACPVKKARGAYILFSSEQRPVIKEENPSATFKEMGSLLGEAWKALSDEDRAKWSDAAAEDKKRYEREYKEWAESNPDEAAADTAPAKIPRKRGAPSSGEQRRKRQKQQAESGGEESDGGGGGDKGGKDSLPKSHFDMAAQRVKRSTNRRVRDEDIDLESLKEAASAFVARMLHAAEQDEQGLRRGRPAVHKIKMIGEVLQQVNKRSTVQEILLDAGLLRAFKDWLTPSDPGSLPNARIREAIYDLLGKMHLDAYYLEQSDGLGRRLMELRNNKRETEANRARLNAMMDRWARDIFQLQTKYRGLATHEGQQVAEIARRKRAVQNAKSTPFAEPTYTKRARIPEPAAFDYAVRPNESSESHAEDASLVRARQRMVARHNQGGRRAAIMKRVKDRSRSKSATSQAHSVNVEGH